MAVLAGVIDERTGSADLFAVNTYTGAELWRTAPFSADLLSMDLATDTEHALVMDDHAPLVIELVSPWPRD